MMKRTGIALDIDETLSWTIGYWVEKMMEKFGNPENLTVKGLIKKYRYSQNVPYWQTPEAEQWMEEYRNSNVVQELLPIIEDANIFVQKIHKIIPITMYLTIRPHSVIPGTRAWLKKHGFPDGEIVARPHDVHMKDGNKWKAEVLDSLYPSITGIIDDNPAVIDNLPDGYKGTVFLYDTRTNPRSGIHVVPCENWTDVYKNICDIYSKP